MTHHVCIWILSTFALKADLCLDGQADGQLAGPLADFCQVSTTETVGHLGQVFQVHVLHKHRAHFYLRSVLQKPDDSHKSRI